ncbi:MAG: DUF4912 domain-containing protein [Clostridia bacterium]
MPKKAKEELIKKENLNVKVTKKRSSTSEASKKSKEKTEKASKTVTKKNTKTTKLDEIKKATKSEPNKAKKPSTTSKTSKKSASTKVEKKSSTVKKSTTSNTAKKTTKTSKKASFPVEYYDLPNSYNQTIVKILAQTPTILFAYWDVSVEDTQNFINSYGEDFFNNTSPFLVVTNKSKNYSFEVEINDYANSWYIRIPDSDCKYDVALIRKPKNNNINIEHNYVFIASSNNLQTPNDHILFENFSKNVFLKNVKSGLIEEKSIASLSFMQNIGRIYNIYDLYKEIYKNELKDNKLDENLTSSKMSS